MIYDLSATHNCLLLNYGIQRILLQGLEAEVASVGSSLASYFSVFHRLLIARLRAAAALCSSEGQVSELSSLAKELVDTCSPNLHTYLHAQVSKLGTTYIVVSNILLTSYNFHAQALLLWLSRHPHGQAFLWLSQELELATAASQPSVWNLRVSGFKQTVQRTQCFLTPFCALHHHGMLPFRLPCSHWDLHQRLSGLQPWCPVSFLLLFHKVFQS